MLFTRFEEIKAWQKAMILADDIYTLLADSKDYGFNDQIQRAAVSVMNNIAEGFERNNNREFYHFLRIAKASCAEVRSMVYLAKLRQKISSENCDKLLQETETISKMIASLMKTLNLS